MERRRSSRRGTNAEDRLTQGGGAESDVDEEGEEPPGLIDHVDEESGAESEEEEFYEAGDGRGGEEQLIKGKGKLMKRVREVLTRFWVGRGEGVAPMGPLMSSPPQAKMHFYAFLMW